MIIFLGVKTEGEKPEKTFSGTFNLRIPPALHAKLAFQAKMMGLSLNSYVTEKLSFIVP
jgi:predicted HicB family RNase H-like nuclease